MFRLRSLKKFQNTFKAPSCNFQKTDNKANCNYCSIILLLFWCIWLSSKMHLKIRANLNIRERCQIQNIGSSFPLGVRSVTALVQLGRGNPDPYPIPMPLCSSWWLLPLNRYFRSLTRCLASLLNLPTGAKMSQQLLWSTQIQTSTTHLFHDKQQTPLRSLRFSRFYPRSDSDQWLPHKKFVCCIWLRNWKPEPTFVP